MELFAYALDPRDGSPGPSKLRSLQLQNNTLIGKEGIKYLAPALKVNKSLINLDLSHCKIGVSGAMHLFDNIATNSTLKHLNLYRNIIDVDGARALGKALKTNKSLTFVDIGLNRIRKTGLRSIIDGIKANKDSALTKIGIRANFITDDAFSALFDEMVFGQKQYFTHIFLQNNFLTEYHKLALAKQVVEKKVNIFVDSFVDADNFKKERLDTTIWLAPVNCVDSMNGHRKQVEAMFDKGEAGLIADIRIRKGQTVAGRTKKNAFVLVEFCHENSIARGLKMASQRRACLYGDSCRVFKSGTKTVVQMRSQKRK